MNSGGAEGRERAILETEGEMEIGSNRGSSCSVEVVRRGGGVGSNLNE